jgi:hypothetical protein
VKAFETQTLLDRITGYDGRTFAPSAGASWLQLLAPYPLDDCLRAVDEHYAINETRIMPAHVRTRCLTLRDLRASAEQRALGPAPAPVLTERGQAAKAEVFRLIRQVVRNSDAALRPPMRADASEPTSEHSTVTDTERVRQIRRLRHEGHR